MIKRFLFSGFIFLFGFELLEGQNDEIEVSRQTAISKAVEEVSPSVVGIHVTQLKRQRTRTLLDPF